MNIKDAEVGMPVRWPRHGVHGKVTKIRVGHGILVQWDNGRQQGIVGSAWYTLSVPEFEIADPNWKTQNTDVYANVTPRSMMNAAHALAAKPDDKAEEMRFFSSVSHGSCPCGIVRSQCRYHGSV